MTNDPNSALQAQAAYNQVVDQLTAGLGDETLSTLERIELALGLAEGFEGQGLIDRAMDALLIALTHAKEVGGITLVKLLDRVGATYFDSKNWAQAVSFLKEAASLAESVGDVTTVSAQFRFEMLTVAAEVLSDVETISFVNNLRYGPAISRGSRFAAVPDQKANVEDPPYTWVDIFYATHRDRTKSRDPYDFYRAKRAPITFGKARVSVPNDREKGEFEPAPVKDAGRRDPSKHILVDQISELPNRATFLATLDFSLEGSTNRECLLYIHGFRNSFCTGISRAAQLAVDLSIDGCTILYSWPSQGSLLSYVVDRAQKIDPLTEDLKDLIVDLSRTAMPGKLHIVAHSMGAEFLLDALHLLRSEHREQSMVPLLSEVVFAAPDVDAEHFSRRLSRITGLAARMTTYTSTKDRALQLSAKFQGGAPRAGAAPYLVTECGADVVDTSASAASFIGHDDFANQALDDLRALLWLPNAVKVEHRSLLQKDDNLNFWRYRADPASQRLQVFHEALVWTRRLGLTGALEHAAARKTLVRGRDNREFARYELIHDQLRRWDLANVTA